MTEFAFRAPPRAVRERAVLEPWWAGVDRWSLAAVLVLCVTGIVLALAASPPLAQENGVWTYHYVRRQAAFTALALAILLGLSLLPPRLLRRVGVLLFVAALGALAALPWIGTDHGKGAVRWLSLGGVSLQPSEFLKPGFVLVAAWLMAGAEQRGGPPGRSIAGLLAVAIAGALVLQPDFGQAVLVLAVFAGMLFLSGAPTPLLLGLGAAVAAAGVTAYHHSAHFARRIDLYLTGQLEPNTQLAYAEAAIREGGFLGVGVAQGSVKWILPDAHTDFIIAVAAEEFGLLLTLFVIGLFLFVTVRALVRLHGQRDPFVRLGGAGLAMLFGMQAFVNLAVAVRLLPAKGMTLPFISYGGSSALASAVVVGALLALTRAHRPDDAAVLRGRI
jgi:cell division protein FtsW